MRIEKSAGLRISVVVLEHLEALFENYEGDKFEHLDVGTFTNCRECGYTFRCMASNGETFTYCVYEHRNSDEIIINGKKGYISMNGDLPYCSKSKWDNIKSFSYNEHYKCAEALYKIICKFFKENIREVKQNEN